MRAIPSLRMAVLLLVGAMLVTGCPDRKPVDPDQMKSALGKRANKFYRAINQGELDQASVFLSDRLRNDTGGPADIPLFADRVAHRFDQVLPNETKIHWKTLEGEIVVRRYKAHPKLGDKADTLGDIGAVTHRWIREEGEWVFDGAVDDD